MEKFTPNDDQDSALQAIRKWYESRPTQPFVLGGLAGTGKTAMLPMLYDSFEVKPRIRYVCPTWKAAHVLTKKLKDAGVYTSATSIHRLLYNPRGILHQEGCGLWTDPSEGCTLECKELAWEFDPKESPQLLVVDEASMADQWIRKDIEMLGCPVLYVGDHGQLPPVKGTNVFQDRTPDALLETIQRQALNSPIIPLSRVIRSGDSDWLYQAREMGFPVLSTGPQSERRYDPKSANPPHSDPNTVYIASTNRSVDLLNSHTRKILGRGPEDLVPGELVMLQTNDRKKALFNGQQGVIQKVDGRRVELSMETGVVYEGPVLIKGLDEIPDRSDVPVIRHSYCITGHKAQGSEFKNVVVYLTGSRPETRQWLYTAVTRAKSWLTFVKAY